MNRITTRTLLLVASTGALTACPAAQHPTRDDTSEPADGETGGPACEAEQAKIKALEAKIAELEAAPK